MATTADPSTNTKRGNEVDTSAAPIIKKPRRNPALSCQLCRVKKIKCDRNRPCSNCVTRKVQCVPQDGFSSPPRDFQFTLAQSPSPENSHGSPSLHSYPYSDPHALAGSADARRLSEAAMRGPSGMSMLSLAASREAPLQDRDSNRAASLLEEIAMGSETYVHNNTGKSPATDGSGMKSPEEDDATPVRPPILSTLKLFSSSRALHPAALQDLNRLLVQLPPLTHARAIIANFVRLVHPLYHVLHTGFIYEVLEDIYTSGRDNPRKDKVAARLSLLYTILAIGAYFWRDADRDLVTGLTTEMLMPLSKQWRDGAIECLSLGNFMSPAKDTIESLQALCLLQLVLHNDGESESYRHLAGSVIRMAQTLGLHCLGSAPKPGESRVLFELKRRLWWFLCSSDWLESTHGGARQGLYTINRRLVDTSLPSNSDDEYITDTMCQSNSLSTPTTMSYFLVRSELSYVCLEAIEVLGMKAYSGDSEVDYDKLLSIDHKYRNFLKNLPVYYRNDGRSRAESEDIIKARPYIGWQRTMVHVGIHCMLIRLHRPFLIRGSQQPRYAFSRMTCLRSAHNILRMIRSSISENADFWHVMRLWIGVHHLFMAAAVLSIDLCWNDDDEPHADSTRDEVLEACKILEKARDQSTIAEQGINVLYAIMRRWKDSSGSETDREQLLNLNKSMNAEEPMSAETSAATLRLTTAQHADTPAMHPPSSNPPLISGFDPSQGPLFSASELSDFGSFGNGNQVMDWSGLLEGLDAASDSWFMPSMTG